MNYCVLGIEVGASVDEGMAINVDCDPFTNGSAN